MATLGKNANARGQETEACLVGVWHNNMPILLILLHKQHVINFSRGSTSFEMQHHGKIQ